MMGSSSASGSYRVGGSLTSSSLSALAPPFKIDKSIAKTNSTNPSMNLFEVPFYGTVFDSAGPFWNNSSSSSASGAKFVATETTSTNNTCPPSPGIYNYPGPELSNSHSQVYYVNPTTGTAYDPFSYDQFPNSMSTSADEVAKPYYPPYVSPPAQKDCYMGVRVVTGPSYDLLSNSGSANLNGCGSSHLDHTKGMSGGGDYESSWDDFWTGVNDGKHDEWKDYVQGVGSKDINLPGLSSNNSHLSVEGSKKNHPFVNGSSKIHPFGEGSDKGLLKQGACLTQGLDAQGKVSTVSSSYFDIFAGAYPFGGLGIGQQDYKPLFDLPLGGTSADCSKMATFVSASAPAYDETPHLQQPVLESVTSFCGAQKANGFTLEEHISHTGSFMFGCTSTTSTFPTTMSKLPYSGSSFAAQSTLSATKANPVDSDAVNKSFTYTGCDSSRQKEPQIPPGLKCQSSVVIRRPLSPFMAVPSSQIGETVNTPDDKNASDDTKFIPQVPQQFSSNDFAQESDDADAIYSVEKHSGGSDVHNPAEDSPCWKGASSTHLSPFRVSEAVIADVLVNNLDGQNSPSAQEMQNKSFLVGTFHSIDLPGKANDTTSIKRPFVSTFTLEDCEDSGSMDRKPHCFDLNTGVDFHSFDDCHVYTEDLNVLNKTRTDSDSSLATQCILKDGETSSARNLSEVVADEKIGDCDCVATNSSLEVPSNIDIDHCGSPPRDKSCLKYCQSPRKVADSRIDINVLLKSMINLSQVLRCYCFNNPAAVMEQQSDTIKHIIDNLNASILMANGPTTPSMMGSSQGTSFQKELPAALLVSSAEAAAAAAAAKLCRTEDVLNSFPFRDDSVSLWNDNMTESIKKILHENVQDEEEMDQHKLLYKNLWLEAEAALCVMTAKARLHRVKIEMEKSCASTKDTDKPQSSNISSDVHGILELASKDKDSATNHIPNSQVSLNSMKFEGPKSTKNESYLPSLHTTSPCSHGNDHDDSGTNSHANDVETCVTARYQILKDRIDLSDSLKYESKQSPGEDDCLLDNNYSILGTFGNDSHGSGTNSHAIANDVETSVLDRYKLLKCRLDNSDSLNYEGKQSSADNLFSNPDKPLQDSQLFNSVGVTDEDEASVMSRFRILQNRLNCLISVDKDLTPSGLPANDATTQGLGWSNPVGKSLFGPFPDFTEDEDVKEFGICVNGEGEASAQPFKANNLSSEIFEGWYDNDHSSSDWEHVSKEDLRR